MTNRRPRRRGQIGDDLFSAEPESFLGARLAVLKWPDPGRFPVNHAASRVRNLVWPDLVESSDPLLVAGFSSIGELIDLLSAWGKEQREGTFRIVLGSEPFSSQRSSFGAPGTVFTDEVRDYWLGKGISLRLSAKLLLTRELLAQRRIAVRYVAGGWALHAKVYIGSRAATLGSSNFTGAGLSAQAEANIRSRAVDAARDYEGTVSIAENYWEVGDPWDEQFARLLEDLLRVTTWREALARACASLLEGSWAEKYLPSGRERRLLWPSQVAGIAQALWVIDNVGSVLIADATGSGKTRMGAHLVRSVQDRLVQSGRIRSGSAALVSPPGVTATWEREALECGAWLRVISHGQLSRNGDSVGDDSVRETQILALDESHNFLNQSTKRTQKVVGSAADHVLLFTATPISSGAKDLLTLVQLLGPDNFDDATIDMLMELERKQEAPLDPRQKEALRAELQRFTVRRTKTLLNGYVDADPEAYRDLETGRTNRYPQHRPSTYKTSETEPDNEIAGQIRAHAAQLRGLASLGTVIQRPVSTGQRTTDEQILRQRLTSAKGFTSHRIFDGMRSSRAALVEHLRGTAAAVAAEDLPSTYRASDSGNMLHRMDELMDSGPPRIELDCELPDWLAQKDAWRAVCEQEFNTYLTIGELATRLSRSREVGKADLITKVQENHDRIVVFDHHPITLAVVESLLTKAGGIRVLTATGSTPKGKKSVQRALSRDSHDTATALCSDALNEAINLQGASAIIHLDIPTTLRVAEQRVGRIDRMDSPYDAIESFWPDDGLRFATSAAELLHARAETTKHLLGANLHLPAISAAGESDPERIIDVNERIEELQRSAAEWDGIIDALEPVRSLVEGKQALISRTEYKEFVSTKQRVLCRVSPVVSSLPWAFFAVAGTQQGAPHWILLEEDPPRELHNLADVTERLRELLAEDPPARAFDSACEDRLSLFLDRAIRLDHVLLPRRLVRALEQMQRLTGEWAEAAFKQQAYAEAQRWRRLQEVATGQASPKPDPYVAAQRWVDLVKPRLLDHQRSTRRRLVRLKDIDATLRREPLGLTAVEKAMEGIPTVLDIDTRISACILGMP